MQNKSKYLYLGSSTEYSKTDIDPKVVDFIEILAPSKGNWLSISSTCPFTTPVESYCAKRKQKLIKVKNIFLIKNFLKYNE